MCLTLANGGLCPSYLAGMFLEDEREATGIQEDVYYKKKPSLLLLDAKSQVGS